MTTNEPQATIPSASANEVHEHALDLARHRRGITKRMRRKQTDMRLEALAGMGDDPSAGSVKPSAPAPAG